MSTSTHNPIFPPEILREIINYADQSTLWRLRRCSRALHQDAEVFLTPFLAEKTLEVEPLLVVGNYPSDEVISAKTDRARKAALKLVSNRLTDHFTSYPRSAELLRRLTVEVRDDAKDPGWVHLRRFSEQLEHLSIRLVDRSYILGSAEVNKIPEDIWSAGFGPSADTLQFLLVTSLHLHTTARLSLHSLALLKYCVNLRQLTLTSAKLSGKSPDPSDMSLLHLPPYIQRLSFTGRPRDLGEIVILLSNYEDLTHLTLNLITESYNLDTLGRLIPMLPSGAQLENLCLYGTCAGDMLVSAIYNDSDEHLQDITTLVLEQVRERNRDGRNPYSLLDPASFRPKIPILKRLIFIDRTDTFPFPKSTTLDGLFKQYKTLQQIIFISGSSSYPADPFAERPPSTPAERRQYVERTAGLEGET